MFACRWSDRLTQFLKICLTEGDLSLSALSNWAADKCSFSQSSGCVMGWLVKWPVSGGVLFLKSLAQTLTLNKSQRENRALVCELLSMGVYLFCVQKCGGCTTLSCVYVTYIWTSIFLYTCETDLEIMSVLYEVVSKSVLLILQRNSWFLPWSVFKISHQYQYVWHYMYSHINIKCFICTNGNICWRTADSCQTTFDFMAQQYICCCYRCWVKRLVKDYSDYFFNRYAKKSHVLCLTGIKIQYYFVLSYSGLHFFRVVNTKLCKMDSFEKQIGEETHFTTH